ncbi:organic cation transporter protein-like isoform X1 [Centruroides sculpturatus]|uniref:organic cation transporter protein-like isoform X1 n=2 Tax=Centruroides sculpturatus TaxID=218467 RepID=UPI000C6E2272|nr:organic cation transporter protein-like isoform X1 [Centruroides sculpturatus]
MDVVCDDRWLQAIAKSSFFFGTIIGSIVFGNLANVYGRKPTFYVLLSVYIIIGILSCFPPNYIAFIVYRTIIGTTSIVIFQIPFVLAMELVKPQKRSTSGMCICSTFPFVIALMCLLAYLSRNWFILSLITSVPLVIFLVIWYFVPESPRWLVAQNRIDEAEVIVQKIAKVNKKKIPPNFLKTFMASKGIANQKNKKDIKFTFVHIIKYPNIRKNFLLVTFGWLVNATVYVGLLFGSTLFNINDYLALTISGLVELPGDLAAWWGMEKYGRRFIMLVSMVLAGISCICAGIVPGSYTWTIVILANIGKFAIAGSYSAIYVFGSELIPTVLRTSALATATLIGSVGSMIAPHILYLGTLYGRALPLIILGILSIFGGMCNLFLPETMNENLPETIEEGEAFGKDTKFCQFPFTKPKKKGKISRIADHRDSKTVSVDNYEL